MKLTFRRGMINKVGWDLETDPEQDSAENIERVVDLAKKIEKYIK